MIIKDFLKKIYLLNITKNRYRKWMADCDQLRLEQKAISFCPLPINERSIILIPHADDEWVGCSSVVCDCPDVLLVNMDMQGGDNPSLHQNRFDELCAISSRYSRKIETLIGNKIQFLATIIEEYNPAILYVPFFFDWHEEHIRTMMILKELLLKTAKTLKIGMYQVSLPIISDRVNRCVKLDERKWTEKWNIFEKVYTSQLHIPYKRFSILERIQGSLCSSFAAEVFSFCCSEEWLYNFDEWLLSSEEVEQVKSNLLDLRRTHELIKEFSSKRVWKTLK